MEYSLKFSVDLYKLMFHLNQMWPALAKQGTSCKRRLTDFKFNTNQQCRLSWSVINQLDQYFQLVNDMLWEEVISEPWIHTAYYINQTLLSIQGLDKEK